MRSMMKRKAWGLRQCLASCSLSLIMLFWQGTAPVAAQSYLVAPNAFANQPGTGTFLGPLANAQRTYQLLIHESQLTGFLNQELVGLAWRLPTSATDPWPTTDIVFNNFDIYLSGSVAPADRSLTFANNVVGTQTQVRSGSLSVPTSTFSSGNNPNNFGFEIGFDSWQYTGGNLLIEIRHSGFSGTSRSVDAMLATGGAAQGYGTLFSAAWTGNYAGVSGSQGNFAVTRLTAIPEPGTTALLALMGLGWVAIRRR